MATFWMDLIQMSPTYTVISRKHLLLTTQSLGVPGTLLIDLFTNPPTGFESASSWLVVGKQLSHYSLILTKQNNKMDQEAHENVSFVIF